MDMDMHIRDFVRRLRKAADAIDELYEPPTLTRSRSNETPAVAEKIRRRSKAQPIKNGKRGRRMWQALQILRVNNPLTAAEIAKKMKLTTESNIYAILERLEDQGKIVDEKGRYRVAS